MTLLRLQYPKRKYGISRKGCSDPRCGQIPAHRSHSGKHPQFVMILCTVLHAQFYAADPSQPLVISDMMPEWVAALRKSKPAGIDSEFMKAAGLGRDRKGL